MALYIFSEDDARRFARENGFKVYQKSDELIFSRCPYCKSPHKDDKNKFAINLNTGQFNCFRASCGARGNMITLARDFNFSLGNAVDEYYNPSRRFRKFPKREKPTPKPAAVEYMLSRGISEEITNKYNITTQTNAENILVFPFYDEHEQLQFVKYRKTDFDKTKDSCKEWCEKDTKPILFGMNHCSPEVSNMIVLTEGQLDSLSVSESGIPNALSVPTGARGFTWIPYCWDFLSKYEILTIFGDCEHGTITLLDEMKTRFHGQIKHVRDEDYIGCKDANEILLKHGKDAIVKAIENAVPVENTKIKRLDSVKRVDLDAREKFSTGLASVDKKLGGFFMGQLIILTGERGLGKSTLGSQFLQQALKSGYSCLAYSGELADFYFREWFDRQVAGPKYIESYQSAMGYETYKVSEYTALQIQAWYGDRMYLYDNSIVNDGQEDEKLVDTIENAIKQYGCKVFLIDNLMTAIDDDVSTDQYRQQTQFVKALAKLVKAYEVLVILICHPRKGNGMTFDNDDISGSSNITNLADVTMRYGKPKGKEHEDASERQLTILKNRLTGRTDRDGIDLYYDEKSKRISESYNFDWILGWEKIGFGSLTEDDSDFIELDSEDIIFD